MSTAAQINRVIRQYSTATPAQGKPPLADPGGRSLDYEGHIEQAQTWPVPRVFEIGTHNTVGMAQNGLKYERNDRLLNARQEADRLGVAERWVRDHTTRQPPRRRGALADVFSRNVSQQSAFQLENAISALPRLNITQVQQPEQNLGTGKGMGIGF